MLKENAHMQKRTSRKSGRGGKALLSGIVRCGRCGRMMRVTYSSGSSTGHRYHCRGEVDQRAGKPCIGIGGLRVDRAVARQLIEVVAPHALKAAQLAVVRTRQADDNVRQAVEHELEEARYEVTLAARRHAAVDPDKRLVARELEARWNRALEQLASSNVDSANSNVSSKRDRISIKWIFWHWPMICLLSGTLRGSIPRPSRG